MPDSVYSVSEANDCIYVYVEHTADELAGVSIELLQKASELGEIREFAGRLEEAVCNIAPSLIKYTGKAERFRCTNTDLDTAASDLFSESNPHGIEGDSEKKAAPCVAP